MPLVWYIFLLHSVRNTFPFKLNLSGVLPLLQQIKRKKLYEEVMDQIVNAISSGEFPQGSKLPSERELAEIFQVSRTVIREAIRSMESVGYLESRTNGTYIREVSVDDILSPLMSVLAQDSRTTDDIMELRLILEPSSTSLVAKRITAEQLQELEEILQDMEQSVAAGQSGSRHDARFHAKLIDFSQNEVLRSVYKVCEHGMVDMIDAVGNIEGQPEIACGCHRKIYQALCDRNAVAAKQAMYDHLKQVYTRLGREIAVEL